MRHRSWALVAFLMGLAGGAINGALWQSHRLPSECLGREVSFTGHIVSLPREQRLATGQRRVTAEMDVVHIDDPLCAGPKRVRCLNTSRLQRLRHCSTTRASMGAGDQAAGQPD